MELAIVIVVMAILVSLGVLSAESLVKRSKIRSCQANLRAIDGAVATYYANYKNYPQNIRSLTNSGYLKKEPKEPFTGQSYGLDKNFSAVCLNNDGSEGGPHRY